MFSEKQKMREERDSLQLLLVGFGFGWEGGIITGGEGVSSLNQITKSNSNSAKSGIRICPDKKTHISFVANMN